ncbi:MAG: hypothetical protein J0L92_18510 [Deltaproteobacteria bacterium]|nr:hypothetical protein [Deltaproteobacteria bacterium]
MHTESSSLGAASFVVRGGAIFVFASLAGCARYYAGHGYAVASAPSRAPYAINEPAPTVVYLTQPSVSASVVVQAPPTVVATSAGSEVRAEGAASSCVAPAPEVTDCRMRCTVDFDRHRTDCRGAITLDPSTHDYRSTEQALFRVDMTGYRELDVEIEACDPSGWVLHVGDSRSNDGWGGDAADVSNDAELQVNGAPGSLSSQLYASDEGSGRLVRPADRRQVALGDRCERHRYGLADQRVSYDDGTAVCDPALLRVEPPSDREGTPDAIWWVGVNRTVRGGDRVGGGVREAVLCLR